MSRPRGAPAAGAPVARPALARSSSSSRAAEPPHPTSAKPSPNGLPPLIKAGGESASSRKSRIASRSITERSLSSERRAAATPPLEPAPTTTKSKRSRLTGRSGGPPTRTHRTGRGLRSRLRAPMRRDRTGSRPPPRSCLEAGPVAELDPKVPREEEADARCPGSARRPPPRPSARTSAIPGRGSRAGIFPRWNTSMVTRPPASDLRSSGSSNERLTSAAALGSARSRSRAASARRC